MSILGGRSAVIACALAGLCTAGASAQTTVDVMVNDSFFATTTPGNPGFGTATTFINVGDTVRWTWVGTRDHSVTSAMGLFDSGVHGNGFTFQFTFTEAGMFDYFCVIHGFHDHTSGQVGGMAGMIMVSAVPVPGAAALLGAAGLLASRRRR